VYFRHKDVRKIIRRKGREKIVKENKGTEMFSAIGNTIFHRHIITVLGFYSRKNFTYDIN
jgi:hypothetical protein